MMMVRCKSFHRAYSGGYDFVLLAMKTTDEKPYDRQQRLDKTPHYYSENSKNWDPKEMLNCNCPKMEKSSWP